MNTRSNSSISIKAAHARKGSFSSGRTVRAIYHGVPILAALLFGAAGPAYSTNFTAGFVMEKMPAGERYAYVAGVVEGLAYARFASDGKETAGMACIYAWFYDDPKTIDLIYAAFGKFPDYTPGAVIAVLAKRKCN